MYKHILIPTDGSPASARAAATAVKLAAALGAKVTGFFAAPPATPVVYRQHLPVGYLDPDEHARLIERAAERYLAAIAKAAKAAGVTYTGVEVTSDYPADEIIKAAKARKCDLIVMASHGHHGLSGLLLGSETQKVLTHSSVPVLVVR
jgi:nucleotide-binding universal stress UspA family protein